MSNIISAVAASVATINGGSNMSETRKMVTVVVDGRETVVEEKGDVKNWGIFYDWLINLQNGFAMQRAAEHNAYKQYILNQQIDIVNEMKRKYAEFVNTISSRPIVDIWDIAMPYIRTIEAKKLEVQAASKKVVVNTTIRDANELQKPDYIGAAYRKQIKVLDKIMNQYKGFRLHSQ